jgi:hypothetical protein
MSQSKPPEDNEPASKRDEALETLYGLREELQTVAETDCPYARYAQNALDELRQEGYDV